MHIALLDTPATARFGAWAAAALTRRGHQVHRGPTVGAADAAAAGHDLGAALAPGQPDAFLAAGWEAGVAAHLAARASSAPVAVRLARPVRRPGTDEGRMEAALLRSSARVLVASAGERDRLVSRGVPRATLAVLPDAVDTEWFTDRGPAPGRSTTSDDERHRVGVAVPSDGTSRQALLEGIDSMPACRAVAVPAADTWTDATPALMRSLDLLVVADDTDAEVAAVLAAMASGVPVVASDAGVLADLVADGVTGLLVGRGGTAPAIRALLADSLGREGMGLAAVDRVRARFGQEVVAGTLAHQLAALVPDAEHAAAG